MVALYTIYGIVHAAMTGLVFFPLAILSCISCCTVRRGGDAARSGLPWLKATMAVVAFCFLFTFLGDVFYVVRNIYNDDDEFSTFYTRTNRQILYQLTLRFSTLATLLERIGDILLIITFVELANGFMFLLDQKKAAYQRILFFAALGIGAILFIINLAYYGKINALYTPYFNYLFSLDDVDFDYDAFDAGLLICRQLAAAFEILCWIISMPLLAYTAFVVHSHRMNPFTKPSAVIMLVAAILSFGRFLNFLIYHATYGLTTVFPPDYVPITDAIFNVWFFFIILMLLFAVGASKPKGLHTGPQSGKIGAPMGAQPAPLPMYGYAPQQHMPMQQQPMYTGTAYANQQPTLPMQQPGGYYQQPMQQPMQHPMQQPMQQPMGGYQPVQHPQQMPMHSYGPPPQQGSPPYTAATSVSPPPQSHTPVPSSSTPAPETEANGNGVKPAAAEMKA